MPTWSGKLVGEVVRLLLEAYYDPQFPDSSHGFRKSRGCHTALREIGNTWTGTTWFIEGDISDCFGSLDHEILLGIMAEKIHDNRFLRLVRHMLKAGYLEEWEYHDTLSGVPQGGTVSPVLSNTNKKFSFWTCSHNPSVIGICTPASDPRRIHAPLLASAEGSGGRSARSPSFLPCYVRPSGRSHHASRSSRPIHRDSVR